MPGAAGTAAEMPRLDVRLPGNGPERLVVRQPGPGNGWMEDVSKKIVPNVGKISGVTESS